MADNVIKAMAAGSENISWAFISTAMRKGAVLKCIAGMNRYFCLCADITAEAHGMELSEKFVKLNSQGHGVLRQAGADIYVLDESRREEPAAPQPKEEQLELI